jgi:hypothetical protein
MVIVHGATPRRDTQPDSPGAVFPAVDFRSVCNFTLCPLSHYSHNGTEALMVLKQLESYERARWSGTCLYSQPSRVWGRKIVSSSPAWETYRVPSQPGASSKILSQKQKQKSKRKQRGGWDLAQWQIVCLASTGPWVWSQHQKKNQKGLRPWEVWQLEIAQNLWALTRKSPCLRTISD